MAVMARQGAADERQPVALGGLPGLPAWVRPRILVPAAILTAFVIVIIGGYRLGWNWTGFSDNTLWNWLQLLILPLVLAGGGFWFNMSQNRNSREVSAKQHALDMQLADNQQQEAALQGYLDKMAELLLDRQLRESPVGAGVREVAHARTVATVWRVGRYRKSVLLKFLFDSRLIDRAGPIISLAGADLSHAQLSGADLHGADLSGAILTQADLRGANLAGASLRNAVLTEVQLGSADLAGADLTGAVTTGTTLERVAASGATHAPHRPVEGLATSSHGRSEAPTTVRRKA